MRACLRMADGLGGQPLERRIVVDVAVPVELAAVPMARVLAHADVGDDDHRRSFRADRADGLLHDAMVVVGFASAFVLARRDAEEQDRRHVQACKLAHLGFKHIDRHLVDARHRGNLVAQADARLHEERIDEIFGRQLGFADVAAHRLGRAHAARAICRELPVFHGDGPP